MPAEPRWKKLLSKNYIFFPSETTIEEVLSAYLQRDAAWFWYLVTERNDGYKVCSFGSLLPYLTGRTQHIVHTPGDCPICTGMDPVLWQDTDTLVEEALATKHIRQRLISSLPMADFEVVDIHGLDESQIEIVFILEGNFFGITYKGEFQGFYEVRMRNGFDLEPSIPKF
jgi:hypothetical protein